MRSITAISNKVSKKYLKISFWHLKFIFLRKRRMHWPYKVIRNVILRISWRVQTALFEYWWAAVHFFLLFTCITSRLLRSGCTTFFGDVQSLPPIRHYLFFRTPADLLGSRIPKKQNRTQQLPIWYALTNVIDKHLLG